MINSIIAIIMTIITSFSFGILTERIIEKKDKQIIDEELPIPILFLLGLFLISLILMLIHFFIPIGLVVYLSIFSSSILVLFLQRERVAKILSRKIFPDRKQLMLIPFLMVCGFVLISHSIDPVYDYDMGLYHLQNIKWFQTFAIVPGLGNLHGRFAFNSNWFLLEALFGNRNIFGLPIFPLNAISIFIFLLFSMEVIGKNSNKQISGKLLMFILLLSIFIIFGYSNSASTDKPCDILIWIIITLFLLKTENKSFSEWDKYSWAILLLSVFVFTIKVSSAIILLLPGILFVLAYKTEKRNLLFPLVFSAFYLFIWFVRNSIISGTIIFPISLLHLPLFDWSMPKSAIDQMTDVIYCWAVQAHASISDIKAMTFVEKYIVWRAYKTVFLESIIFIGLIGNFLFSIYDFVSLLRKGKRETIQIISIFGLHIYFCIALVYWYLSAPDPRFAYGIIFASASLVIARILKNISFSKILIDALLLALSLISLWMAIISLPWNQFSDLYFYPPSVTEYEIIEFKLPDGQIINKPVEGDQCWDAPLPCSGWIYEDLIMRSYDLSDGFKIQK